MKDGNGTNRIAGTLICNHGAGPACTASEKVSNTWGSNPLLCRIPVKHTRLYRSAPRLRIYPQRRVGMDSNGLTGLPKVSRLPIPNVGGIGIP